MLDRVLVVDDVALNREIFIAHLGDAVRHVDEAADGWAALTRFKLCCYDAVLLDIEMPGLDGYDTLNEMRAWERERCLPPTPVVAITSSDFPEDEQRILAAGATAYLVKPVKQQELMAALHLHCIVESSSHPMASLLPRFFAYAGVMLDELAGLEDPVAISKKLHQLRGMIAVYGFVEFAKRLKLMHLGVQRGEMPKLAEFEQLREELQTLKVTPPKA
jgi:CheY-like chemotaxis protein